jgi:hypothetical protein
MQEEHEDFQPKRLAMLQLLTLLLLKSDGTYAAKHFFFN